MTIYCDCEVGTCNGDERERCAFREIELHAIQLADCQNKYNDLIMSVARKFPNETRHETALRYILEAETQTNEPEKEPPKEEV